MGPYTNLYRQNPATFGRPGRPGGPGRPPMNNRFVAGGFLGPFLLGGLTGGLVAPFFYNNRPPYYNQPPYYYPPYYRPY